MAELCKKIEICSHLKFRVNSNVSGLSNVIVDVTAFILQVDEIQIERRGFDTPP